MSIKIVCKNTSCQAPLQAPEEYGGQVVKCGRCGMQLTLPGTAL